MTEWYSHFDPTEFVKAMEVQKALLHPQKPAENGKESPEGSMGLKVLKMPEPGELQEQKPA